jgi:hypothetical protein
LRCGDSRAIWVPCQAGNCARERTLRGGKSSKSKNEERNE